MIYFFKKQLHLSSLLYLVFFFISLTSKSQVEITLDQQFNGKYDFLSIGGSMNSDDNLTFINGSPTFVTVDNSSAFLNLPNDATVVKAYLYWAESFSNNNQTITLNGTQFTADEVFFEDLSQIPEFFLYGYRKEISNYVTNNPNGLYEVTNIDLSAFFQEVLPGFPQSQFGFFDTAIVGWSIIVIYEQDTLDYSQINLYDGFIYRGGIQNPTDLSISLTNLDVIDNQNSKVEFLSYLGGDNASDPTANLFFNNFAVDAPPLNPVGNIINSTNTYTGDDEFWNMDLDVFDISNFINVGDVSLDIFLELTSGTNISLLQRLVTKVRSELPNTSAYFNNITGQNDCDNRELSIDWVLSNENSTADLIENVPVSFYYQVENGNEVLISTVFINQNIPIDQTLDLTETLTIPAAAGLEFDLIIRSNDPGDGSFVIDETNNEDNTDRIEITLFESPEAISVIDLVQCSNLLFNLENAIDELLNPEDEISFFLTQNDAENDINSIADPQNYSPQNLIETIFLRRFDGNCFAVSQFQVESLIPPQINTPLTFSLCDLSDTQDGFAEFDLSEKVNEITGGNSDYEVNFFTTQSDAEDLSIPNGIVSPYTNETPFLQTIYVRVEDITNNCLSFTQFDLEVNLLPVISASENIPNLESCDEQQDGSAIFDLTINNGAILNGLSDNNHSIEFYTSLIDAENDVNNISNPESFISNEQEIFARVTNINTNCYSITSFGLEVDFLPFATQPDDIFLCDIDNDQIEDFDFSIQNESILNGLSETENIISYHETFADAENKINPIGEIYTNENNSQTIYVRLENFDAPNCYSTTSFNIEVLETPVISIEEQFVLCENEPLVLNVSEAFDEYLWSTGESESSITINAPGIYDITAFINYPELICETTKSFEVFASSQATINDITIVDWSQNNNSISIFVEGDGVYEYSIDGFNYQDSNTFEGLTEYEYLVHIRDKNGCGETLRRVFLLDYPKFFTPNEDGFNDRWQIINSNQEIFTKIYIFDRYGKLIADINPTGSGWDGTMNGKLMPSNDYWFRVEREDGRVFTGHFTLKR